MFLQNAPILRAHIIPIQLVRRLLAVAPPYKLPIVKE